MLSYETCKEIALKNAETFGAVINKAYKLKGAYVFDDDTSQYAGGIPIVVDAMNGSCFGLWRYLNDKNLTMDDMIECEL